MKTILFIDEGEKDLWALLHTYDFLFDELRRKEWLSVCKWHKPGADVSTAVPELGGLVDGDDEWQALVVTDLRRPNEQLKADPHFDNPFDFEENYTFDPAEPFCESERALVRLTQMLGGLPERAFIKWPEEKRGVSPHEPTEEQAGSLGQFVAQTGEGELTPNPDLLPESGGAFATQYESVTYSEMADIPGISGFDIAYAGTRDSYDVIERYRLGLPRPSRIICMSPRDVDDAFFEARERELAESFGRVGVNVEVDPRDARTHSRTRAQASTYNFWQRNGYPPSARFIVVDSRQPAAKGAHAALDTAPLYADDSWFYLCVSIIAVATGTIHPIDLKPFELYQISVGINETELVSSFAHRRAEWEAALKAIEQRLVLDGAKLQTSEYRMANLPVTETLIPVSFDQVDGASLKTDPAEVKLIKDKPAKDIAVWISQKRRITDGFKELLRAPKRALRNAAAKFRGQQPIPEAELEYCILNEYQKDKMIDELRGTEFNLAKNVGTAPFEEEFYAEDIQNKDDAIKDEIEKRATSKQVAFAVVLACAALIIGCIPYIFGACGGVGASASALLVTLACCALLGAVCLVTLLFMRKKVRSAYVNFSEMIHGIYSSLTSESKRLEEKISTYATFRKKWSIYDRQLHLDMPTKEVSRLEWRHALLETRIQDIESVINKCHKREIDRDVAVPERNWDQVSRLIEDNTFYELGGIKTRGTLQDGAGTAESFADVPYSFIENVELTALKTK